MEYCTRSGPLGTCGRLVRREEGMLVMRLEEASRWRSRGNCCWNMLGREEEVSRAPPAPGEPGEGVPRQPEGGEGGGEGGEVVVVPLGAGVRERWG